ncbi:MAG: hypothetical protein LC790_06160, partial [Actinobacteria bacterium]|nr:hypothetical protein [Actinomycetota bacterium]
MATISSLLADHVTLQVRSVDRLFLAGYVPRLQCEGQLVRFMLDRAGGNIPSPAILGHVGRAYVDAIDRFALDNEIPVVRFKRHQRKEDHARPYFQAAEREGRFGVVLIGVAQEKASAWRGWREGGNDAHPHFEFGRQAVFVNHYYFYIRDREWGPSFVKTNAYAPYPVWLWLGGHEWAKRQAAARGIEFSELDNGFRSCEHAEALGEVCDSLSPADVEAFFERWMGVLPSPFTVAERSRYRYGLSVRQLELSDTRVFDRPAAGRAWFEQAITDQLDLGRPDRVQIVFDRKITRATPGIFQTKVITRGVAPVIQAHYKHSKVKQYLKEGRALRTETTVNDPYDFGVGRLLTAENWQALLAIGEQTNQRLLDAQLQACDCAPDPTALEAIVLPSKTPDGQPAPGLRFGDPRVMALLACLCHYGHLFNGLTNASLRELIAELIPGYAAGQATYDLRRVRRKGLIRRIPHSQRYELTTEGRRVAVFFTKTY